MHSLNILNQYASQQNMLYRERINKNSCNINDSANRLSILRKEYCTMSIKMVIVSNTKNCENYKKNLFFIVSLPIKSLIRQTVQFPPSNQVKRQK